MSTSMLRLYDVVDQYRTALEWMEENEDAIREAGGEIPPELDALLSEAEGDMEEKVKRVTLVIQTFEKYATAAKAEADRLTATARSHQRQADTLTNYLQAQLERAGVSRMVTDLARVRIQRASRPSIRLLSDEIPEPFRRVIPERVEFDGNAAYEHVKPLLGKDAPDSFDVDGLHVEYSKSLRIW